MPLSDSAPAAIDRGADEGSWERIGDTSMHDSDRIIIDIEADDPER